MSGSFAQGTFLLTGLAHLAFCLSSTVFAGWLPRPTRSPCFWWCDFRRTSGTTQPSDHFQSTASAGGLAWLTSRPCVLAFQAVVGIVLATRAYARLDSRARGGVTFGNYSGRIATMP